MTTFGDGYIKIFDRENLCVDRIFVPERTVIIDNGVMEKGKEGLALFSGFHEGGHIMMHWDVFSEMVRDGAEFGCEFESDDDLGEEAAPVVCCRRSNIESAGIAKGIRTADDWREHQADYFAAAIAMPNVTFKPFVHSILRDNSIYKGAITVGLDADLDILADDIIPDAISDMYGVSRRAARIKLRKTGFVFNSKS
jgi:Zn-dependent peptidase ImmA (M78 family)